MAKYIVVDFTDVYGGTARELDSKYRQYWLKGYGFKRYIQKGAKTYMLLERGADYSDINIK